MMRRILLVLAVVFSSVSAFASVPPRVPTIVPSIIPGGGGLPPIRWVTPPTDQSVNEGVELAFSVAAKSGGQTVTYSIGANDSGAVNASTGEYTWTPSYVAGNRTNKLTTNADFELGDFTEWYGNPTYNTADGDSAIVDTGYGGSKGLRISVTGATGIYNMTTPSTSGIPVTEGKTYIIKWKSNGDRLTYNYIMRSGGNANIVASTTYAPLDGYWEQATATWTAPTSGTVKLMLGYQNAGADGKTVVVDDVSIEEVGEVATYTVTFTATAGGKTLSKAITVTVNNVDITLAGSVTDSVWATNLTGATVMAVGVDTATVDGDGNYSLTLGDPGVYTIVATHTADYDTITVADTTITAPATRNILIATYGQHVKGAITTNTTWAKGANALGWYRVDGNISMSGTGITWAIEPGVTVKFDSTARITIGGTNPTLQWHGTFADSILFVAGKTTWRGLLLNSSTLDTAFRFVRISNVGTNYAITGADANKAIRIVNSTIAHNTAGAISSLSFFGKNCIVHNNYSASQPVSTGTWWNTVFTNNHSTSAGTQGSLSGTFYHCVARGNYAIPNEGTRGGGAFYASTLYNCTVDSNYTTGGYSAQGQNLRISTSTNCVILRGFSLESTPTGGGSYGGTSINSLYLDNVLTKSGSRGGGAKESHLLGCTFFGNDAVSSGDQIYSTGQTITNTVAWQIDKTSYFAIADSGDATVSYSNIWRTSGTYGTAGSINSQPLFVDSTRTDGFGWLLREGSPGIAGGNNYRDMGIGFGYRYPDYRSWRPCAWGQAQSHYLALPGANLDSAITYRIEGTIGTATHPTYDAYTGLFTWTPEEGDIGTYPFVFWAKMGEDSVSKPDTLIVERGYTALSFDGGDFSRFGNRNIANAARNALTVATWIYVDTTGSDAGVFWGKGRTADSDLEWQIRFRKSAPCSLRFVLSGDGTTEAFSSLKWTDNKSKWQHVAMTYAAGVCSIYVNGVLAATDVDATSPAWPAALYAGSGNLTVGAADYSSSTTGYNAAKGRLAMPTAYAGALTSAQIAALYAETYAGGESMKLTRTNGTTTAGTTWYDDAGNDGLNGESGAIPGLLGHYAVWPIAGDTGP